MDDSVGIWRLVKKFRSRSVEADLSTIFSLNLWLSPAQSGLGIVSNLSIVSIPFSNQTLTSWPLPAPQPATKTLSMPAPG